MTLSGNFRSLSPIRVLAAISALSAWLLVPAGWAQYSSSLDSHPLVANLAQDQYPNQGGYSRQGYNAPHSNSFSHIAIEGGAGFTAPVGNTTTWQTFGYNVAAGAGWNFTSRIGVLAEYHFNGSSIPTATLNTVAEPAGHVHIWDLDLDPIIYYKRGGAIGGYVTGGGGFYRKVTTFTQPVFVGDYCDYFYGCYPAYENITLSHFSSNQGGYNIGTGFTHKLSPDGRAKVYAEVRYIWLNSPKSSTSTLGTGTVGMVPVTFGLRW